MDTTAKRRFFFHYLEMVVAMLIGMGVFAPVWHLVFGAFGSTALERTDVMGMSSAKNMVVGMWLGMWFRGHRAAPMVEMGVAMYLPFVVLLVPLWLGAISGMILMTSGHILMLGPMLYAMLRRRDAYTRLHHTRWPRRRPESATEPNTAA